MFSRYIYILSLISILLFSCKNPHKNKIEIVNFDELYKSIDLSSNKTYVINLDNIGQNAIWDRYILPGLLEASSSETTQETNAIGEINPSASPFANDVNDQLLLRKLRFLKWI